MLPGWEVRDIVAHLIGTESMLLGLPIPESDIDVRALPHVHNLIGEWNEHWVRHFRGETAAGMLAKFRDVTGRRREVLGSVDLDGWNTPMMTPAGLDTLGRFMRIRTFDCWMHEHDIRDALGLSSSDLAGDDTRLAMEELIASIAFVVGKLGQAPQGSRVVFDLTGPIGRTIRVAVGERAALVDDFGDAAATVTIRLDGLHFTRLCGGRVFGGREAADIVIEGDTAAGRRIVERLAYVF